jgi:hypothetical protein
MLKFGFKKLIEDKDKPLFPFPYLVVGIKPTEPKKTTNFKLVNSRDLLKFDLRDNRLSWLYDESGDKTFYLINIYDVDAEPAISVTLELSFSNKNLYERMVKVMKLDETKEHYFQLIEVEPIEGLPTVKLVEISETTINEDEASEDTQMEINFPKVEDFDYNEEEFENELETIL